MDECIGTKKRAGLAVKGKEGWTDIEMDKWMSR